MSTTMKQFLSAITLLLLVGCASIERVPTDYAGPDAGTVVIGIGAAAGTSYSSYAMLFRKRYSVQGTESPTTIGRLTYFQTNIFYKQQPDYQRESEAGVVLINSLPPGDYEIYNFDVFYNSMAMQRNYSSRAPLSIPFTVRSNETTYLGNYQANRLDGRNLLGLPLPAGAVFVVSNRSKTEMEIAQAKKKGITGSFADATPDVKAIASPFFISPQSLAQVQ
jgi:hypothetical protein